jgi:uncharacterized protein (TIGR02453 family)
MDFDIILKFLKSLAKNNDRAWFEKNKAKYLQAKDQFDQFVAKLVYELADFDQSLAGLDPKKITFRIYRDVRFSKNKLPYKSNMSAGISPRGKMVAEPGVYLHIQPNNKSFVAAGLWMPEPEPLGKIRQEIDYNGNDLIKIMTDKKFKKMYGAFETEYALKNVPKGYEKDHPQAEWLKLKSFVVSHYFTDEEVKSKNFIKTVIDTYKTAKPLNDFLKEAIA